MHQLLQMLSGLVLEAYNVFLHAGAYTTGNNFMEGVLVVCEPFVLRCGAVNDSWFPEFEQRRAVAEKLAVELKLTFVPFQQMFNEALKQAPANYWAGDGVHPTLAGHALMAKTWREVVGI